MAVGKYIGSRYVPKAADPILHDSSRAYEHLMMVKDAQGGCWMSTKPVPPGVPLAQGEYWMFISDWDAQVAEYHAEVQRYVTRIDDVETNVEQAEQAIASETQERTDADAAIRADLATETQTREAADTAIREELTAETQEQAAAIAAIREQTEQAIATETQERTAADAAIINRFANMPLEIHMFDGSSPDNITCTLVQGNGANFLIDTGNANDHELIVNWLRAHNVETLDGLIITHFHSDHCSNQLNLVGSQFVTENTYVWRQMPCSSANSQYDDYQARKTALDNALSARGFHSSRVPDNGSVFQFGDDNLLKLTFYNTDPSYANRYDNYAWSNNATASTGYNQRLTSLNNFSLIVRFDLGNSSYLETGDIEGEAQRLNAADMQKVNVARNPHHFANKQGYELFYDRINPDYWLVSNHFHSTTEVPERIDVYAFNISYLFRYLYYNSKDTNILTNISQNVDFVINNGIIEKADGHYVDVDYNIGNTRGFDMPLWDIIPPDVYTDNPYYVVSDAFSIEDCYTYFRYMNFGKNAPVRWYIPTSGAGNENNFAHVIRNSFIPAHDTGVIFLTCEDGFLTAWFDNVGQVWNKMRLRSNHTLDAPSRTWVSDDHFILNYVAEGTFSGNNHVPDTEWANMRTGALLVATLDTGEVVHLGRKDEFALGITRSASFCGYALNSANTGIYYVNIAGSTGTVTVRLALFNGGTDTSHSIKKVARLL